MHVSDPDTATTTQSGRSDQHIAAPFAHTGTSPTTIIPGSFLQAIRHHHSKQYLAKGNVDDPENGKA
jgi:AraC-like DNA-binding protein